MGEHAPWFLVRHRDDSDDFPGSNAGLVQELVSSGSLRSEKSIAAFKAVDRQHFWPSEGKKLAYADMPLRSGRLHLSAPHIYAKAIESLLPLEPGMSFLNIGSGTGYFNSIVSEMIGPLATNHGVEIWPETLAHAERCCAAIGKSHIKFTLGNVYQLDVSKTIRYDRIYLGACANSRSKYLYRLLEVGGILIGPFQVGYSQQLRRVVRQSETQFNVELLGSVQFASLLEPAAAPQTPPPAPPPPAARPPLPAAAAAPEGWPVSGVAASPPPSGREGAGGAEREQDEEEEEAARPRQRARRHSRLSGADAAPTPAPLQQRTPPMAPAPSPFSPPPRRGMSTSPLIGPAVDPRQLLDDGGPLGLPGVPFTFTMSELPWSPERHWLYPETFRRVVLLGLLSHARDVSRPSLPAEIWVKHVLPWCPKWWFEIRSTPRLTPLLAPRADLDVPTPTELPSAYTDFSDDDGAGQVSTREPSSAAASSTRTTPERGPSEPPVTLSPHDADSEMPPAAEPAAEPDNDEDDEDDEELFRRESLLFEVFGNGHRHAIGGGEDPDDIPDEPPRLVMPFQLLQLLAHGGDAVPRRRPREEEPEAESDDEDENVELMADAGAGDDHHEAEDHMDVDEGI